MYIYIFICINTVYTSDTYCILLESYLSLLFIQFREAIRELVLSEVEFKVGKPGKTRVFDVWPHLSMVYVPANVPANLEVSSPHRHWWFAVFFRLGSTKVQEKSEEMLMKGKEVHDWDGRMWWIWLRQHFESEASVYNVRLPPTKYICLYASMWPCV